MVLLFPNILGIRIKALILAGDSSGGNLALCTCLRAMHLGLRQPSGLLLCYPPLVMLPSRFTPSYSITLQDTVLSMGNMLLCKDAYLAGRDVDPRLSYISPLFMKDDVYLP